MHDLVIRGATVVDGTGAPARRADVAVDEGRVASVGSVGDRGREEVDAGGLVVTPGFVDPHTHLDAALFWDPSGSPSCHHGVTTVVMGLCGFGVAPCPPGGEEYLLRSLERVEEIPFESTSLGVPFGWSAWAEFFDAVGRAPLGVNVAGYVPHSALRFSVMGERARGETATGDERAAMVAALREALAAGAVGLATSRGPNHQDAFGDPVPSRFADDAELAELVAACGGRVWQVNLRSKMAGDDPGPMLDEVALYAGWTAAAGARLTWSPLFADGEAWPAVLDQNRALNQAGTTVAPQVTPAPVTLQLRFDRPGLVTGVPGWQAALAGLAELDAAGRRARLADESVRAAMRAAPEDCGRLLAPCYRRWRVVTSPSRPDVGGLTLAELAASLGAAHPVDALLDLVLADDLATVVQVPILNADEDRVMSLLADPLTLVGLGDAGAHVNTITSFGYPTHLLARMVRDTGRLSLEHAVHALTGRPARFHGILDRGTLEPGQAADICLLDLDRLALGPVRTVADLPGGHPRLLQEAEGYVAVWVNGRRRGPGAEGAGRLVRVG